LFLFQVERTVFQIVFLLFCIPAFFLHGGAFPFMLVFLFACAEEFLSASTRAERIFLGLCSLIFLSIIAYELRWIIYPINAANRDEYINGLRHLTFMVKDDRWNLRFSPEQSP